MLAKLDECLLSNQVDVPSFTCSGEDAGCFKHEEGEVLDYMISEEVATCDADVLDFAEVLPQSINGIIRGPDGCNAGATAFQLGTSDGTIIGA